MAQIARIRILRIEKPHKNRKNENLKIFFEFFKIFEKNPQKSGGTPLKKFFHDSKPLPIDSPIEKTPCIRENYSFRVEMAKL
jgi:hypothetical protein